MMVTCSGGRTAINPARNFEAPMPPASATAFTDQILEAFRLFMIRKREQAPTPRRRRGAEGGNKKDQERLAALSYQPSAVSYQLWRTALLVSE